MTGDISAADRFWREEIYSDLLRLAEGIVEHPWSRRQIERDSQAIAHTVTRLREIANDLYLARRTLRAQARQTEAEVGQLRGSIERLHGDDGHPHESGDECIGCERLATERGWPYCNQCLLEGQLELSDSMLDSMQAEIERLRGSLKEMCTEMAVLLAPFDQSSISRGESPIADLVGGAPVGEATGRPREPQESTEGAGGQSEHGRPRGTFRVARGAPEEEVGG